MGKSGGMRNFRKAKDQLSNIKRHGFYLCFFILAVFYWSHAASSQVQITEIAPHKVNEEAEWFEFRVWGDEIDLSSWEMRDTNGKAKKFIDYTGQLLWGAGVEVVDLEKLQFTLTKSPAYFAWTSSPLSLPNAGGLIELWDGEVLLAQASYPKLKSGTYQSAPYAEVWTYDTEYGQFYPRLHRTFSGSRDSHSKLRKNQPSPPFPQGSSFLISEVGMKREDDFVELFVQRLSLEQSSLEYLIVKHNGSPIYQGSARDTIKAGDYLVIYPEKGLSGASGTIEVILWAGTSWEKQIEGLCYKKGDLSQGEQKRVDTFIMEDLWKEDCYDISNFSDQVSLARNIDHQDTNRAIDFFAHVHGSPGGVNINQNHPPKAVITLQNTDKYIRKVPFSVNLTGTDSVDPDGEKDIVYYDWMVNDVWFSDADNPTYFRIEKPGRYVFRLQVEDLSGDKDTAILVIEAVEKLDHIQPAMLNIHEQEVDNTEPKVLKGFQEDPFFGDFVKAYALHAELEPFESVTKQDPGQASVTPMDYFQVKTARDRLAYWGRLKKVESNLGQIFLEGS